MSENNKSKGKRWPLPVHDQARLEYGRLLWRRPSARARLLKHWQDERHPYSERFAETYRPWVEKVLEAKEEADDALDEELSLHGLSLRVVVREIPPVFGSFY
ncbi:MAG TPA: hypothetical protein VGE39_03485 [Prosthecobacter sp.]